MLAVKDIKTTYPFEMDGFLFIHRAMLRDMQDMNATARRFNSMSREDFATLYRWFKFYWEMVEIHHVEEDEHFFKDVLSRVPELAKEMESLTRDHQELHELVDQIGGILNRIQTLERGSEHTMLTTQLTGLLDRFTSAIADHLAREEEVVIPAISRNFNSAEQKALGDKALKSVPAKHLSLLVPWVASALSPEEAVQGLKTLPLPLRWLYRLSWKKKYEKFSAVIRFN